MSLSASAYECSYDGRMMIVNKMSMIYSKQPKDILFFMRDKKSMSDVRAVSIIILFSFTESQERISCMYFLNHEHV